MQAYSSGESRHLSEELIANIKTKLSSTYDLKQYMKENNLKSVEEAKKELEKLIKVAEEKKEGINKLKVTLNTFIKIIIDSSEGRGEENMININ